MQSQYAYAQIPHPCPCGGKNNQPSYIENELIIWINEGIDEEEFAANSNQKIVPKRPLGECWNIWLFEFTDKAEQRSEKERSDRISNLKLNKDVKHVQNNHTNWALRGVTPNDTHNK